MQDEGGRWRLLEGGVHGALVSRGLLGGWYAARASRVRSRKETHTTKGNRKAIAVHLFTRKATVM